MISAGKPRWTSLAAVIIPPGRRTDLREELLDGEAIILDPDSGDTHRLNEAATIVWHRCDGSISTRQIAAGLAELCDIDFENALDSVEQIVTRLVELKLFDEVEER